jgi:parvulin-like peptidyl-prolyl isomerase
MHPHRHPKLILLSLLVLALAACGGGSSGKSASKLAATDVAVVGATHIPQEYFNSLMSLQKLNAKQQGQTFPKQGTTGYQTVSGQVVTALVQAIERQEKAASLGITVTDKQVQTQLTKVIKQNFGGSQAKYKASLKTEGVTDAFVRFYYIKTGLLGQKLYASVTKDVSVSQKDVTAYYATNLTSKYTTPESRDLRHILVKSKTLANSIYKQLQAGNDQTWCTLAKKYSEDPSSKDKCGKLTVTKGETVPVFDKVAFSQPTKQVHAPVYDSAQYKAYFIIEPLAPIKPAATTPEKKVEASIKQTLLASKKNAAADTWATNLTKSFCSGKQIVYQIGFAPSPDPCATFTSSTATNNTTT